MCDENFQTFAKIRDDHLKKKFNNGCNFDWCTASVINQNKYCNTHAWMAPPEHVKETKESKEKRNVSGYMKRIIASEQNWCCMSYKDMLKASYEVDHIIPLCKGGTNNKENLVALCRNCHGEKTFKESC